VTFIEGTQADVMLKGMRDGHIISITTSCCVFWK